MNRKLLTLALLIMVVSTAAAGLYLFSKSKAGNNAERQQTVINTQVGIETTQVSSTEIPAGFPDNLPTEARAEVLQNYKTTTTDGRVQSTRVTTTARTLAQAVSTYENFFSNLGWDAVPSQTDDEHTVTQLMKNGDDTLLIVATDLNPENKKTISLTLTQAVKSETNQANE